LSTHNSRFKDDPVNAELLRSETADLVARYESEPNHTLHVARLALSLFDALSGWHGLGAHDRLLIETAAKLHDIGWSCTQPDGKGHHKASAKIIRSHAWQSLSARDREIVAQVARYHRKSPPGPDQEDFMALQAPDRDRVSWLAACLRIGDGLDRRHIQRVLDLEVRDEGDRLLILVKSPAETGAELLIAKKKADLLESLLGRKVVFTEGTD
jgi:exopolyphosphatase/guanosine-5'-triphosphate,3'-diphosphate pyrophosphatase